MIIFFYIAPEFFIELYILKQDFTDETLLKQALKAGEPDAFVYLMDTYHHPLCLYVNGMSRDFEVAKDVAQNVFIKVWERRDTMTSVEAVKSYLYTLAHNEFVSAYRKQQRDSKFKEAYLETLNEVVLEQDDDLLKRQVALLNREIENLPDRCKETFLLSKRDGLTNPEIAEYMQVTTKTVEMQMTRAYRILREKLKDQINPILFIVFGID